MRVRRIRVLALAFLVVVLVLPVGAQAAPFTQLIVFGDSLSDNGNVYAASAGTQPLSPPYAQRYSNGPVAVEYLAASWGIPLLDYAYGGATTGTANFVSPLLPGMQQQLAMFAASLGGGPADPDALYFVLGGQNDAFLAASLGQDPFAALAVAAANIGGIVGTLQGLGARHVLLAGMPDLGLMPALAANRALGTAATDFYNGLLQAQFANTPVTFFDTAAWTRGVVANPAAYGFTNVVDPCLVFNPPFLCGFTPAEQNLYLFWDSAHPTTSAHELFADELQRAVPQPTVPEPATAFLLAAGLVLALRRSNLR